MQRTIRLGGACIALLSIVGLSSCKPSMDDEAAANDQHNTTAVKLPPLPAVEPPLDRAAVLLAIEKAASALALGQDDRAAQAKLDGKRIEVRIRFGCPTTSAAVPGAPFQVRFSEKDRTLRLSAAPDLSLKDVPVLTSTETDNPIDQAEGFWIRRPWIFDAGCPVRPPSESVAGSEQKPRSGTEGSEAHSADANEAGPVEAQGETPPSPRVGIAQYFTKHDSRLTQRDGRPYEATKTLGADESPSSVGYDLVLAGRLRATPQGRVIECRLTDMDHPPVCIVFAHIDSVRMERPDTGSQLAEWSRQ